MKHRQYLVTLMLAAAAAWAQRQPVGVIRGTVSDASGRALRGAVVVVGPNPVARRVIPFSKQTVTDAQGRFEVKNVPAGEYQVCPQVGYSDYLNPCLWENIPPMAAIATTGPRAVAEMRFKMELGVPVFVQVVDLNGTLAREDRQKRGDRVSVGLRTTQGDFLPARPPSLAPGRRVYRMVVKGGKRFHPLFGADKFDVDHGPQGNQSGRALVVRAGDPPKVIELTVRGKKP